MVYLVILAIGILAVIGMGIATVISDRGYTRDRRKQQSHPFYNQGRRKTDHGPAAEYYAKHGHDAWGHEAR